ncbi:hypothetical protein [Vibrio cholerae]|nr:hypothetical protein [Vibrio cholerae]HDZ9219698.1 hypothetical protein [Vibrio cholerae]
MDNNKIPLRWDFVVIKAAITINWLFSRVRATIAPFVSQAQIKATQK